MSDKILSSNKEPGVCVETGHGRSGDPSPRPAQKQYSNGSSKKQQNRTKGNYGSSKDKRQRYPRSGPGTQLYTENGGQSTQGGPSRTGRRYSGDQRWSDQRNRGAGQDKRHRGGRDGLKDTDNPSPTYLGLSGSPTSRPGSGDGGRKKSTPVSLNHLLNFTVAPTERRNSASNGGMAPTALLRRRRTRQGHSYNKEQFLQANCQFVVSSSGDYTVHSGDPDRLVDWDSIEQVRLFCHQIPSCPICLYPPTAAKITRCGHVYCWSCVLHYLSLGDKKWRKCPICYESIYKHDLKSVIALSNPQFKVGNTITMKLMMREKGTTLVCPKSEWSGQKSNILSLRGDSAMQRYVKLLSATPTETLELIVSPERQELQQQLSGLGEDGASEKCFVEAALEELKTRESSVKQAESVDKEVDTIAQALQKEDRDLNNDQSSNNADSSTSTEPAGPVWTAYSDKYFEGEFTAPFSDLEEEGEGEGGCEEETTSSGSGDNTSLEDNPAICMSDAQSTQAVDVIQQTSTEGKLVIEVQTEEGVSKAVELESPLSVSSDDSPNHLSPRGSQTESNEDSPRKDPLSIGANGDSPRLQSSGDIIYFYQAADGQHLYIHPINAKCLAKEYGGLENAPDEIKANVVEMEQLTMSEDVRGRYRYLSHLPLTCEFVLCELDLKPPLLSQDTIKIFYDELQKRKQKRVKKRREERRKERKREPNPEPSFQVPTEANEMTPERFHDILSLASSPPLRSSSLPHPLDTSAKKCPPQVENEEIKEGDGEEQLDTAASAPSFAQALRGKPTPVWPIRSTSTSRGSSRVGPDVHGARRSGEEEQDDEESQAVPSFQNAFNEALLSASVSVLAAQSASEGKPGSRTAKKGRKKLVLFSTGGMRGVN